MPLFESQRETLRKLVAMAKAAQKTEFYYTQNSMGDHVDFEVAGVSSHSFDRGRLGGVMPTEYVMPTSRCRAFVTDVAFDAVDADFAVAPASNAQSRTIPMTVYPAQQAVLRQLVAASEEAQSRKFWIIKTDDEWVVKFGLLGGPDAKKLTLTVNAGAYADLEHSAFIEPVSKDSRWLTDAAIDAVRRDFSLPPATPVVPPTSVNNTIQVYGNVTGGTLTQGIDVNVAVSQVTSLMDGARLAAGQLADAAERAAAIEQLDNIDDELKAPAPKPAKLRAFLTAMPPAALKYSPLFTALTALAKTLGLTPQ